MSIRFAYRNKKATIFVGGNWNNGSNDGYSYLNGNNGFGNANTNIGFRLNNL